MIIDCWRGLSAELLAVGGDANSSIQIISVAEDYWLLVIQRMMISLNGDYWLLAGTPTAASEFL